MDSIKGTIEILTRSEEAAFKTSGGYYYTARPTCSCGYKGKWCGPGQAQDLAEAHRCDR